MSGGIMLGAPPEEGTEAGGFAGEVDELVISRATRPAGHLLFATANQGASEAAARVVVLGEVDGGAAGGHSATLEHVMLFGDIAKNMMFDGWIAVGVCVLMILCGWTVAVRKFTYLNSIQKGTDAFLKQWKNVSSDLTVLDHDDEHSVKSMGGAVDGKLLRDMHRSPLYHLYHIGSEEIRHRLGNGKDRSKGLSARSIQAIRASLESGLVRENQRMNKGLIMLTISIAGGPYVGLLGTVVGVMITFAIISKSGEVEVNSIAPGIASALLATVAGLVVAIPALFIYSYLSSRIKDLLAAMQVFIDEFIAKMAEFYPTPSDMSPQYSSPQIEPRGLEQQLGALPRASEPQPLSTNHAS
jgi:biopolymer transport protein ExbB